MSTIESERWQSLQIESLSYKSLWKKDWIGLNSRSSSMTSGGDVSIEQSVQAMDLYIKVNVLRILIRCEIVVKSDVNIK